MRLEHEFSVPAAPETVWPLLLDVERVAPCLPGAEVAERLDEGTYKVTVTVALGPMKLTYRGDVTIAEADPASMRAVMRAKATETRGQGTASATITTTLSPDGTGTRAAVVSDVQLTGRVAQMGQGIVRDVSNRMLGEFAECLSQKIAGVEAAPRAEPRPIRGFSLLWALVRGRLRGLVRR